RRSTGPTPPRERVWPSQVFPKCSRLPPPARCHPPPPDPYTHLGWPHHPPRLPFRRSRSAPRSPSTITRPPRRSGCVFEHDAQARTSASSALTSIAHDPLYITLGNNLIADCTINTGRGQDTSRSDKSGVGKS